MKLILLILTLILTSFSLQAQEANLIVPYGISNGMSVQNVKCSPNGQFYLLNSFGKNKNEVIVYELKTQKELFRLLKNDSRSSLDEDNSNVHFIANDKILMVNFDSDLLIFDIYEFNNQGHILKKSNEIQLSASSYIKDHSPNGKYTVYQSDSSHCVIESNTGSIIYKFSTRIDDAVQMKFSHDERFLLIANVKEFSEEDNMYELNENFFDEIKLLDLTTLEYVLKINEEEKIISSFSFHPVNNNLVLTYCDGSLLVWDNKKDSITERMVYSEKLFDSIKSEWDKNLINTPKCYAKEYQIPPSFPKRDSNNNLYFEDEVNLHGQIIKRLVAPRAVFCHESNTIMCYGSISGSSFPTILFDYSVEKAKMNVLKSKASVLNGLDEYGYEIPRMHAAFYEDGVWKIYFTSSFIKFLDSDVIYDGWDFYLLQSNDVLSIGHLFSTYGDGSKCSFDHLNKSKYQPIYNGKNFMVESVLDKCFVFDTEENKVASEQFIGKIPELRSQELITDKINHLDWSFIPIWQKDILWDPLTGEIVFSSKNSIKSFSNDNASILTFDESKDFYDKDKVFQFSVIDIKTRKEKRLPLIDENPLTAFDKVIYSSKNNCFFFNDYNILGLSFLDLDDWEIKNIHDTLDGGFVKLFVRKNDVFKSFPYKKKIQRYNISSMKITGQFQWVDTVDRWLMHPNISPNGKWIIVPIEQDNSVVLYDAITFDQKYKLPNSFSGNFINNKYLLTNTMSNKLRIYDIASKGLITEFGSNIEKRWEVNYDERFGTFLTVDSNNVFTHWSFDSINGVVNKKFDLEDFIVDENDELRYFSRNNSQYIILDNSAKQYVWDCKDGSLLYTRLQLKNEDWLAYDEYGRFDGTTGAIDYLYLTCGTEIIDLSQVKDSLWVPGLVEKIMTGQEILINDRPAPELSELNVCALTPIIEPLEKGKQGEYRYRVIPRRGGLGETEVYINGNLTYSFRPEELELNEDSTYNLTLPLDSIKPYLSGGAASTSNPMLVKAKVKGASIYGRGEPIDVPVEISTDMPKFYGVFVGVNDYGNPNKQYSYTRFNDLDYASKDAMDLSKAIEASARTLFGDSTFIYRLSNTDSKDYNPSKSNLELVFNEIGKKAKANDVLFVFFAGHGSIDKNGDRKEIKFMLEKADKRNKASTGFGVADLSNWCHPRKVKAQKRVFVFDACHSGQFVNEQIAMASGGRGGKDESTRIRQLDKLKDKNGMMILAAAADDQSAYEDITLDQGVLTYHLLDVIQSEKDDIELTVRDWFEQTISRVEEYSNRNGQNQSPNSFGDGRFEIGNINELVRQQIDIKSPKIRIGECMLMDPTGDAESGYPNLIHSINTELTNLSSRRGKFVYSEVTDKTYTVKGSYYLRKKKLYIRYRLYYDNKELSSFEPVVLGPFKNKSEEEITSEVLESFKTAVLQLKL